MAESLKTLPIGTRVYYTGDMANMPARGTIVEHKPSERFSDQLRIQWDADDDKPDSWIGPVNFNPGVGQRFYRLADWEAKRQESIDRMKAQDECRRSMMAANNMAVQRLKVAAIREPGYPVGQPAPMYLNCPCGAKPAVDYPDGPDVHCVCGRSYYATGWLHSPEMV